MTGEFFVTGADDREDRLVGYTTETALAHAEAMVAETGEPVSVYEKREGGPAFGTFIGSVFASDTGFSVSLASGLKVTEVSDEALAAASPEYAAHVVRLGCRSCGAGLGAHHRAGCEFVSAGYSTRVQASQAVKR